MGVGRRSVTKRKRVVTQIQDSARDALGGEDASRFLCENAAVAVGIEAAGDDEDHGLIC
jgi:hypothetical protein